MHTQQHRSSCAAPLQLNPEENAFQRRFVNEVRRCDELSRKLRFFAAEVLKAKLPVDAGNSPVHEPAPDTQEMQAMEV